MKNWNISSELFAKNREKIKTQIEKDSIAIVPSNDQMYRNGDQFFPYRQSSDLFYLTGIYQEKTILTLCPDHPDEKLRECLFILRGNKKLEIWEGHKLTLDEASEISGIKNVQFIDNFDFTFQNLAYHFGKIYVNVQENLKFPPIIESPEIKLLNKIKTKFPLHDYKRLSPVLRNLRLIKESEEIDLIKTACQITGDSFQRVLTNVKPGMYEYEIEAEISYEFIRKGAGGHAYPPIIAAGKNALCLHYIDNNAEAKDGDLVLMDFGAEVANYAADCSRTFPVNGKFSPRQLELYNANLRVFKYARSLMKPGATLKDLHNKVCKKWEEEHIQLGLYTKKEAEEAKNPLWFKYYMHGTMHPVGLDVHDVGTNKDEEFKPGMILTCEPAIYVEEEGIGVRIENDILITEDGNIDLMDHIPLEAEEIEAIIQNARK
jgi:Xaa-Pro aminopeptidase